MAQPPAFVVENSGEPFGLCDVAFFAPFETALEECGDEVGLGNDTEQTVVRIDHRHMV